MRILHLADLHLGKNIGSYSLLDDQKYCLNQILDLAEEKKVDLVIIAGDIFDIPIPPADSMEVYSKFLERLIFDLKAKVIAISGNHDSARRLEINNGFFEHMGYYIFGSPSAPLVLKDDLGKVYFYPIPYLSLSRARAEISPDIGNFTDIYRFFLKDYDYTKGRNVLISHCYANPNPFEAPILSQEGERPLTIGGYDAMDAHLFLNFDYVALGHLHRRGSVIEERIAYPGTFMPYSFSEAGQKKYVNFVNLRQRAEITPIEIKPKRKFRRLKGYFEELIKLPFSDDYIEIILKDESPVEGAMGKLKRIFPRAVNLTYENLKADFGGSSYDFNLKNLTSMEIFQKFYFYKMGREITDKEKEIFERSLE